VIKIEFSLAVALYLILTTCFVLMILIFKNRKDPKQFSSEKFFLLQCSICTYIYVDSRHANISQCPRCGSYNKKEEQEKGEKHA
jgi:rRNA maturation endonuclease Nob1